MTATSSAVPGLAGVSSAKSPRSTGDALQRALRGVAPGTAGVAVITFLAFRFGLNFTSAAFLHLIVVVLVARQTGFWRASFVSVVAVMSQLYFLVPPVLTFSVADPLNWFALGAFEYCALTVSGLSDKAARQTTLANLRQRETEGLYELSRLVLTMDRAREPGQQLADLIQRVFHCNGVAIFDAEAGQFAFSGEVAEGLEGRAKDAYHRADNRFDDDSHTWYRVLRMGTRAVGSLAICNGGTTGTVANALASLAAVALDRAHCFERESRADAARQSELLRSAVLDAMAHDVKTPLTAIRAASSGLLASGALKPRQSSLIALIDKEAARLNGITNRLLGTAKLDGTEIRLNPRRVPLDGLVRREVAAFKNRVPGRAIRISGFSPDMAVAGDDRLLSTGLAQLVDNAIKYSAPYSAISIHAERGDGEIVLSVHNRGSAIPPEDLERIFERFYRAPGNAERAAGTGLGLSITRKIASAHCGRVWAESDAEKGTTLFLALPIPDAIVAAP